MASPRFANVWGRLGGKSLKITLVFLGLGASIAALQHWFVGTRIQQATSSDLEAWATQISGELKIGENWNLEQYRRASISVPSWYVLNRDGLLIDVEGLIPGIFGGVDLGQLKSVGLPQSVRSDVGEEWRLLRREVSGGVVVVGINASEKVNDIDGKLASNSAKFGSTLSEAEGIKSRDVDPEVDYAVVDSSGSIRADWGGVPLKIGTCAVPFREGIHAVNIGTVSYLVYVRSLIEGNGQVAGYIMTPKEITSERSAVKAIDTFNYMAVGGYSLVAISVILMATLMRYLGLPNAISLESALETGESGTIEFKSSLFCNLHQDEVDEEKKFFALKAIAGFLNSNGGQIFFGVTEEAGRAGLCGLSDDLRVISKDLLKTLEKRKDLLLQMLRAIVTQAIGASSSHLISEHMKEAEGKCYIEVTVAPSPEPAFVKWRVKGRQDEQVFFFVREGVRTNRLDTREAVRYIKSKWG